MSNIRAITGSSKIVYRNQGGGSKKQGIPSSTNLITTAHVAFRNRNVVCPCHRHKIFCMNQLGGIGAGGVPGNSYMFAPGADGINKNKILCGFDVKNIRHPSQFELIYSQDTPEKANNPMLIGFFKGNAPNPKFASLDFLYSLKEYNNNNLEGYYYGISDCERNYINNINNMAECFNRTVVGNIYGIIVRERNGKTYPLIFRIRLYGVDGELLFIEFLQRPSFFNADYYQTLDNSYNPGLIILKMFKYTGKI